MHVPIIRFTAEKASAFYASGIESYSGQYLYGSRIHDLKFTDAGFTYNCEYQTAWVHEISMGVCEKSISELVWHGEDLLKVQTMILTNLNDMKIEDHIEDESEDLSYISDDKENIGLVSGTLILQRNGYEGIYVQNSGYLEDTSYIQIPTKFLPQKNAKLYSLFPALKGVNREEGVYAHIYLSPRTNNLEILSLILDEDEDLDFSLVEARDGYYGNYRIKGEIHYITEEEYEQFQKEYWEYREQERAGAG